MPELSKDASVEGRKPATTGDVSKIIFSILDKAKELDVIVSEIINELLGSPMKVQGEKDLTKKASEEGWLEDNYQRLCEIRGQMNRAFEKAQLLKSRVGCPPRRDP